MHQLQQHILHQLIRHHDRRYAQLKPEEIEGNLFMYHLRQLTKAGLVDKRPDGHYELTAQGHRYADGLSLKTFTPRAQPRLTTLLVCQNQAGQYLFLRRKRQPLLDRIGFPHGKVHLGEGVVAAAHRELQEKTGLSAQLAHRGDGYLTYTHNGEPVSQIFFHLFVGREPVGNLTEHTSAGEVFWAQLDDLDARVLPSVPTLLRLLEENPSQRFFAELSYEL